MIKITPHTEQMLEKGMTVGGSVFSGHNIYWGSFQGGVVNSKLCVNVHFPQSDDLTPNGEIGHEMRLSTESAQTIISSLESEIKTHGFKPESAALVCCGFIELLSSMSSLTLGGRFGEVNGDVKVDDNERSIRFRNIALIADCTRIFAENAYKFIQQSERKAPPIRSTKLPEPKPGAPETHIAKRILSNPFDPRVNQYILQALFPGKPGAPNNSSVSGGVEIILKARPMSPEILRGIIKILNEHHGQQKPIAANDAGEKLMLGPHEFATRRDENDGTTTIFINSALFYETKIAIEAEDKSRSGGKS